METKILDEQTRSISAFASFNDLLEAKGDYRPSIGCKSGSGSTRDLSFSELMALQRFANAYDAAQKSRGDSRRVYRY